MPDQPRARDYEKLLKKRANAVRAITFQVDKVNALADDKTSEAHTRMLALEAAYEKFKFVNEALEDHDDFDTEDFEEKTEDVVDHNDSQITNNNKRYI